MTILDANAIIGGLLDEPCRKQVERLLRDKQKPARIAAVNLAEVVDQLVRVRQCNEISVDIQIDRLILGGLDVVELDEDTGRAAGRLRARHYHVRDRAVSLADCVAVATALRAGESIASSDADLVAMARDERVKVVALPNSSGRKPT